ncbi:hypothetical protein [Rothia koreensis]|uniref:hypothetical protein n=1 Tax=Rothia koreensis TaxID=592378 RepID=UPI003FCC5B4F
MIEEYTPDRSRNVELPTLAAAVPTGAHLRFSDGTVWYLDRTDLRLLMDTLGYALERSEQEERSCFGS